MEKCHLIFLSQNSLGWKPISCSFRQAKSISLKLQKSPEDKNNIISFRLISNWLASKFIHQLGLQLLSTGVSDTSNKSVGNYKLDLFT